MSKRQIMTKILPRLLISLACIMIFYHGRSFHLFETVSDSPPPASLVPLLPGETVTQDLSGLSGSLSGVSVQFETYGRINRSEVGVQFTVNGQVAARTSFQTAPLLAQSYHTIRFPHPVRVTAEDQCALSLGTLGDGPDNVGVYLSGSGGPLQLSDGSEQAGRLCCQFLFVNEGSNRLFSFFILLHVFILLCATAVFLQDKRLSVRAWVLVTLAGLLYTTALTDDLLWGGRLQTDIEIPVRHAEQGVQAIEPGASLQSALTISGTPADSIMLFPDPADAPYLTNLHVRLQHASSGNVLLDRAADVQDLTRDHITGDMVLKWNAPLPDIPGGLFEEGDYLLTLTNRGQQAIRVETGIDELPEGTVVSAKYAYRKHSFVLYRLVALSLLLLSCFVLVLSVLYDRQKLTAERFFLAGGVFLGMLFLLLNKPSGVSDADTHFLAAYRYANLLSCGDGAVGRTDDLVYYERSFWDADASASFLCMKPFIQNGERIPVPDENAEMHSYSVFCYLPQVAGMVLAMLLRLDTIPMLYLARLFILAAFVAAGYYAIRITPAGKHIFLCAALLPGSLVACTSFSYDAMVLITCMCFLANCLRLYEDPEHRRHFYESLCWAFLLGAVKGGGYLILLPVLLILVTKNKTRLVRIAALAGCGLFSALLFDVLLAGGQRMYQLGSSAGYYTAEFALRHPSQYLGMLIRTYVTRLDELFLTALSGTFHRTDIMYDVVLCILVLFTGVLAIRETDRIRFEKKDKYVFALILLLFVFLVPAMMMKDTPVGADTITGLQGRYYLPVLIPAFLLFTKFELLVSRTEEKERSAQFVSRRGYPWLAVILYGISYFAIRTL